MSTRVALPRWGIGTAPLGGLYQPVEDVQADQTLERAWELGFRYFDTAPLYGAGQAEHRVGRLARRHGDGLYSTKCGRVLEPSDHQDRDYRSDTGYRTTFDFSPVGIRRSVTESLERLGLDRIDLLFVHDPDEFADALPQIFETLATLQAEGTVGATGIGMNQWKLPLWAIRRFPIDVVLLAGRWTLLDQSGRPLLDEAQRLGVSVVVGGVFNSGVLASTSDTPTYDYESAPPEVVQRARALASVCQHHGTDLATAAIQFACLNPAVSSVLVGVRSAAEVDSYFAATKADVTPALWAELRSLDLLHDERTAHA